MRFGTIRFCSYTSADLKFRNRVFPHKVGLVVTILDVLGVIEDEVMFGNLCDEDSVRLCLILALEVIFMGRLFTCPVDDSLFGLVENLEAWNVFPWGEHVWTQLYDSIKNVVVKHSDTHYLGFKKDRNYVPTYTLTGFVFAFQIWILESFERSNRWWINAPQVIPRAIGWSKKSIFKRSDCCYLFAKDSKTNTDIRPTRAEYQSSWWIESNLKKSLKRHASSFRESSSACTRDNRLKTRRLTDRVIRELNVRVFKLETIIQVLALERNDKLGRLQFNEDLSRLRGDFVESLNILFQDLVDPHDSVKDIANEYLVDEELNAVRKKRKDSSNRKREFHQGERFEHIDLWVDYMWHGRRENANWAMVSCYFVQLLMQNNMPLFYANGDKYGIPWSDVDQVFIPINETDQHWCLAHLDILSGLVTFYDSGDTYDYEWRDSSKKLVPKYIKFIMLQKLSECKRSVNFLRGEVRHAIMNIDHLNGLIEMMEVMEFTLEIYDSVWCLKEMVKAENKRLLGLNKHLVDAEEDIKAKEGYLEILEEAIYSR
ncbi:phospholipase-like protein [Tanacetum coccineum]|uniref:Phospholipase-like protein n=1 Tax=Tanacetum coccineum TaxID=301880 RepID=A0ABQ5IHV2_9ASTR